MSYARYRFFRDLLLERPRLILLLNAPGRFRPGVVTPWTIGACFGQHVSERQNLVDSVRTVLKILLVSLSLLVTPPVLLAEEVHIDARQIGFVEALSGTATAVSYTGEERALAVPQPVFLHDFIRTGAGTRLQLRFEDESVFVVTQNSEVRPDEFIYDPEHNAGLMKIYLKGVFRFVTGRIAKIKPENAQIELPAGFIGIRGTRVAGRADLDQSFVMLEAPGINEEAGHWLSLGNEVGGKKFETVIQKAGYGAQVAKDQAPKEAGKVDKATLKALMRDLGGKDENLNAGLPPIPPPPAKKPGKVKKFFKGLGRAAQTASDIGSAAS